MSLERWSEHLGWSSVWQHRAGSASFSMPPTDILPLISSPQSSHTQPYTASFVSFPLPRHHPPTHPPTHPLSLKYFLLLWFSCRCLPSEPCLAQHPLLPGTSTLPLQSICRAEAFPFIVRAAPAAPPSSHLLPAITHLEWKQSCSEQPHRQHRRAIFTTNCFSL